ncbi:MAG TPA: sigma-70 family RNA polymerase sigma factor [Bryobacteraceae bacterium]|nr:sigma-70 family RNA polymerase sigma factor [Bryobacteraceae bacterium]
MDATPRPVDDRELIEMTLAGFGESFEALMDRHLVAIRKRVSAMIANKADADDVIQDVQLKTWRHLSSFRHDSSFRTWITRIAVNEALQFIRRSATQPKWAAIDLDQVSAATDCPERSYARQETADRIRTAIGQLPAPFRQMLELRELQELSVKEAAGKLKANPPLVKTRLFRARIMLARALRDQRKKPVADWQTTLAA